MPSKQPRQSTRWTWPPTPSGWGWSKRGEQEERDPLCFNIAVWINIAFLRAHLNQEIGSKEREEDDGGTAKDDELDHGEDQPGQQQASKHNAHETNIL